MPPTNAAVSSKLVEALQQRGGPELQNNALSTSQSTPFQPRRRKTSFGVNPTPTRTPSMTLHHRRRAGSSVGQKPAADVRLLPRLEEENANLPPQDSSEFILAQIERQNALLDEDPKSVCIQSNELKAHLSTMQNLVSDLSDTSEEIDWEFWTALTEDFGAVATKLPHLLSAKLKAGIPSKLRGVIWQAMSQSASLHLETVYGQLVAEHSPYERIIQRDLARTFPNVEMFKQEGGDGQKALERVLKAYSLYDAHVGYCQGLAFLVGPLLMNMPEQQAFCVFVRLMETYELRTMFTLNMEGLQLRLYQFTSLLSQILPELSEHLATHAVHPPMYASQWFLTLFAYAFPIPLVLRIYDIVFAEGAAETIMRVAIAILQRSQEEIMQKTEFEDILDYVTSKLHLVYNDDASLMINDAMALSGVITREKMDNLTDLYLKEVEQEKKQTEQVLAVRFKTASKQSDKKKTTKKEKRESAGWLRKRSSSASASSISSGDEAASTKDITTTPSSTTSSQSDDTAMLHQQIEDLLLALSQMQKDHIQMKQELVQERMDRMDVEAERDALKMTMLDLQQDGRIDVLSEIARLKNQNMQLQQQLEDMQHQSKLQKDAQTALIEQMMDLKNAMERVEKEKLEITKERDALLEEQKPIKQRLANAEKAAQELQLEKLRLLTDLEQEQNRNHARMRRRPTSVIVQRTRNSSSSSSSSALQESSDEQRCHELEQLLADAKLRIAELETFGTGGQYESRITSPSRKGFDPNRNMQSMKRASFYGRLWSSVKASQETPPTSPI